MWFKSWYAHPVEVTGSNPVGTQFHWLQFKSLWVSEIAFLPGQYLNTDFHIGDHYQRRSYTPIRCSDGQTGFLIQNFGGLCSSELSGLTAGSVFRISGASGKEKRFAENQNITFIAFGSGISFVFSLLSLNKHLQGSTVLYMGLKSEAAVIIGLAESLGLVFNFKFADNWTQFANQLWSIEGFRSNMGFFLSGDGQKINFAEKLLSGEGIRPQNILKEIYYHHNVQPDAEWFVDESSRSGKDMKLII
ncbi:MAG: hypothetical protein LCH54_10425 [Bacteroidetes bacterium]|nr:hypothetical protein [Bacteroidota bacterium]